MRLRGGRSDKWQRGEMKLVRLPIPHLIEAPRWWLEGTKKWAAPAPLLITPRRNMIHADDNYKDLSLGSNKHKPSEGCVALPSTKMGHPRVETPSQVLVCTVHHGHQRNTHQREERKSFTQTWVIVESLEYFDQLSTSFSQNNYRPFQGSVIIICCPYKLLTDQLCICHFIL